MGAHAASAWSNGAAVERVKVLYLGGRSATQIVVSLRSEFRLDVTRNAVIGLLHRHGVTRGTEARQTSKSLGSNRVNVRPARAPKPAPVPLPPSKPLPPEASTLVPLVGSLMALRPRCCKWPYGHADFQFCGRTAAADRPYCESHITLARSAFQPSKKDLPKTLRRYG